MRRAPKRSLSSEPDLASEPPDQRFTASRLRVADDRFHEELRR